MFVDNIVTLATNRLITSLFSKTFYARFVSIAPATSTAEYLFPWELGHRPHPLHFCHIHVKICIVNSETIILN